MAMILPEKANIERFIANSLQCHFNPKECNLSKRVRVTADLEKFKPDIADIWQQKKGNEKFYSIYFDNEYVCRMSSKTSPQKLELDFLKGFTELYKADKIKINEAEYEKENDFIKTLKKDKKDEKEKEDKRIEKLPVPVEVRETLKNLNEGDYKKTVINQEEIDNLKNGTADGFNTN